jgi:hypothetical protein
MRRFTPLVAVAAIATFQVACTDSGAASLTPPTAPAAARGGAAATADPGPRRIEILDACDPTSFNAAIGAGTCSRPGGMNFDQFIAEVTQKGSVGAWRFAPANNVTGRVGQVLLAMNRGGEVHTFTEVEEFGGGIVPLLNQLSGNTTVAPECLALAPDDFIPPGGSDSDDSVESGTEKYQCCIHPWMRVTVTGRGT